MNVLMFPSQIDVVIQMFQSVVMIRLTSWLCLSSYASHLLFNTEYIPARPGSLSLGASHAWDESSRLVDTLLNFYSKRTEAE